MISFYHFVFMNIFRCNDVNYGSCLCFQHCVFVRIFCGIFMLDEDVMYRISAMRCLFVVLLQIHILYNIHTYMIYVVKYLYFWNCIFVILRVHCSLEFHITYYYICIYFGNGRDNYRLWGLILRPQAYANLQFPVLGLSST